MSSARISERLRQRVASRAEQLCEYCLIHNEDAYLGMQVDHIISKKHGGRTSFHNLALACACCNRQKGTDIFAMDPTSGKFVALYNPRKSLWRDHFQLVGVRITWRTGIGAATVRLLKLNHPRRILERQVLRSFKRYPSSAALRQIKNASSTGERSTR
jgi:hypothetical protein